ncbi:hydrogenase maturation protease [Fervidibacter sp.]|jgi:hydrogenase maturation protease
MPKVLVVCYGNPLRGDDGVGWIVAEKLQQMSLPDFVAIQTHIQLTPELAADLSEADLVIFIDARDAEPVGVVSCKPIVPLPLSSSSFSHHLTPDLLLSHAQHLFGRAPKAFLISVNGSEFGYQDTVSPAVREAAGKVVEQVLRLLEEFASQSA